jgi:hypothetical protein
MALFLPPVAKYHGAPILPVSLKNKRKRFALKRKRGKSKLKPKSKVLYLPNDPLALVKKLQSARLS